ncbi:MAG: membrane protein insertion efficiency factor YidD [Bdellovibrionia bacterium]
MKQIRNSSKKSNIPNSKMSFQKASEACLRNAGLFAVGAYRTIGPAILGGSCRFEPSCSEFAAEALHTHSPLRAFRLIGRRLVSCRPGGPSGFDPVPLGGNL